MRSDIRTIPPLHIREATPDDAVRISYLIRRNTEYVADNQYSMAQKQAWIRYNTPARVKSGMQQKTTFCAFQNNRLLGTISLSANEVTGLYVSYARRKSGIGRLLLAHLECFARKQGIRMLTLTSTPSAKQFYLKNGYVAERNVGVIINGVAFPETAMTKTLD